MNDIKTIFWNVDTQYDFMRDDESFKGALPVPSAREIEGNLEQLTKLAKGIGIQVVNTADWHTRESKEISDKPDYKTTFPPHCLMYTKGAMFVEAVMPENPYVVDWRDPGVNPKTITEHKGNYILFKDDFDIFKGNPHTDHVLQIIRPDKVFVYGVAGNVCVNYAVNGLLDRGIRTFVVVDAIKNLPGASLDDLMAKWQSKGAGFVAVQEKAFASEELKPLYEKYGIEPILKYVGV